MAEIVRNNLQIAEEPEFEREIPAIDPEDPVHFLQMNNILEKLLGNDVFLDKLANKMIEKNLIAHILDCENNQMVLGADQAPVITGLIDGVKEDVTQLYSEIGTIDNLMFNNNIYRYSIEGTSFTAPYTGIYSFIGVVSRGGKQIVVFSISISGNVIASASIGGVTSSSLTMHSSPILLKAGTTVKFNGQEGQEISNLHYITPLLIK